MACTSPKTVSFDRHGRVSYSALNWDKQYAPFKLPCGKCLACRLDYAKQWAVRCVHESAMHEKNSFITLTYSDENLKSPKLDYTDFQKFMKKLRKTQDAPIGVFVTGEYGERNKRPHWHAIFFGYRPADLLDHSTTDRGDLVYTSATIDRLWGKNDPALRPSIIGDVTIESAGYTARYAAKKLVHRDEVEQYEPISKKSSKHAIGKKWLEKNYKDIFDLGRLRLANGVSSQIPRYYERWFKDNHPESWLLYVTERKSILNQVAQERAEAEHAEWLTNYHERRDVGKERPRTQLEIKKIIQDENIKRLHERLKL